MRQPRDWEPAESHGSDSADFSDEDSSVSQTHDGSKDLATDREFSRCNDVRIEFEDGKLIRPQSKDWPDNRIKTTKYTWYNFVVLNLYEQLHKFAAVYFLAISLLMYLGQTSLFVGTIKYFSTLSQQVLLMCASGAIALRDDLKRGEADKAINESKIECFSNDRGVIRNSEPKKWKDVKVGDILRVRKDQEFPADIVPLCSSGEGGNLYVSTANLDGETNLKLKTALESTHSVFWDLASRNVNEGNLRQLECRIDAEPPKESIHDFKGSLSLSIRSGGPCMALGPDQLLLRGTVLRNTDFVVGVVVYTGKNTRMVLNSRDTPMKQSNIEKTTNKVMYIVLATQAVLALMSDLAYLSFRPTLEKHWYLFQKDLILPIPLAYWLTFFVLYSNLMPITLYATTDICNFFHAYFIRNDKNMFYKEMSFPAGVRSTNLCQELGQVSYIFSDKTGTLTQNVMELKRVFIGGRAYGDKEVGFAGDGNMLRASPAQEPAVAAFFQVLAVCHTVMVSEDTEAPGGLRYEAESPDDGALVQASAEQACVLKARRGKTLVLEVAGQRREYEIVATNAFTSARKRMSVVVKREQEYLLLVKGADNVVLPLARGHAQGNRSRELERALDMFSREGLRTLVIAQRTLDAAFVTSWLDTFNRANADLGDREGALERVAAQVESGLELLGATAIEDKLQEGVQRTIQKIRDGGIKFWVLTGDKLETAREIGFSANVLTPDMMIHVVDRDASSDLNKVSRLVMDQGKDEQDERTVSALMITGAALVDVMASKQLQRTLLEITQECAILMACRVSPLQKSQLVQLVRDNVTDGLGRPVVTLAIGDGANDVPMIQTAQVGVGIAGKEGRQSVNNADFAIGQFEYLERLLFLHGRWNYLRACKFTLFTFWRNAVQVLMIAFYTHISGCFSGTALFEESIRITFNGFGTLPIIATGLFDQDVNEATALENAKLYRVGREQVQLSVMKMFWTLISAFSHCLILQLVCYTAFPGMDLLGVGDYYSFGTLCFTCLLIDVFYRNGFLAYTHNRYTAAATVACVGGYVLFCMMLCAGRTYSTPGLTMVFSEPNMLRVPWELAKVKTFWVCVVCAPMMAMAFDTGIDFLLDWKFSETQMSLREDRREALESRKKGAPGNDSDSDEDHEEADAESPLRFLQTCCDFQTHDHEECSYAGIDLSDFAQQTVPTLVEEDWFQTKESRRMNRNAVCVIGIILIAFGGLSYRSAHSNKQVQVLYAGDGSPWRHGIYDDFATPFAESYVDVQTRSAECSENNGLGRCTFSIKLFDTDDDILIAYRLGPFYQNQNDYESSEVFAELEGKTGPEVESKREQICWAQETREVVTAGQVQRIVPCGMKATSIFNDTFDIDGANVSYDDLAWKSDTNRYDNPKGYMQDSETSWLPDRYPEDIIEREKGVKSDHFAAWMRVAALDIVWKRWGWIKHTENNNLRGKNITVTINNNFNVSAWGGSKQLVFTQLSSRSGSSTLFAHLLTACGVMCFVEAMLFTIWLRVESPPCDSCRPESENE